MSNIPSSSNVFVLSSKLHSSSVIIISSILREPPNLSRLELTHETAVRTGNTVREWVEEVIRWMFRVSAEEEWHVFVGVVAGLWSLSYVGSCMDLLTFLYIGRYIHNIVYFFYQLFSSHHSLFFVYFIFGV